MRLFRRPESCMLYCRALQMYIEYKMALYLLHYSVGGAV